MRVQKILLILKEQFSHLGIIFRVAQYENKASYQGHYLGLAWEFLNPLIQIGIYYLIFGIGVRGNDEVRGVPFIVWMLFGISCWFFINKAVLDCSKSIQKKVGMVSKMKFPVSVLPSITIVSLLKTFFVMIGISIVVAFFFGIYPTIYWLQIIYYFVALIIFLFFFGLLNSTITLLVRDYHIILQSLMRILFYFSGPIWVIEEARFPAWVIRMIQLNPFFYIINGFRDAFLSRAFFWEYRTTGLFFWGLTLLIAILGTHLHLKFRSKFVDLL